jgi:hypothetical protein
MTGHLGKLFVTPDKIIGKWGPGTPVSDKPVSQELAFCTPAKKDCDFLQTSYALKKNSFARVKVLVSTDMAGVAIAQSIRV